MNTWPGPPCEGGAEGPGTGLSAGVGTGVEDAVDVEADPASTSTGDGLREQTRPATNQQTAKMPVNTLDNEFSIYYKNAK